MGQPQGFIVESVIFKGKHITHVLLQVGRTWHMAAGSIGLVRASASPHLSERVPIKNDVKALTGVCFLYITL